MSEEAISREAEAFNREAEGFNKAREAAARREKARSNVFRTVDNPTTPYDPTAAAGDNRLRHDHIEDVLNMGSFPVRDLAHNQVGWTNQRLDLLLSAEQRRLLDTMDHAPSREEALVNLLKHNAHGKTPEQLLELATKDKNSDASVLRALIIGRQPKPRVEPATPAVKEAAEQQWLAPQPAPAPQPVQQPQTWASFNLPSANPPAPRVPVAADKNVSLTTPMGRINLSVLDVVQVPDQGFAVIVQREDAPFVFVPPRGHEKYTLDGIPHPVEFSGVSFVYNGVRSTVMVMVN